MPTLSSNIVKREVASVSDVEEALARQAIYGGDLATNLLELASVSEFRLSQVIAESVELAPAPAGELPHAPEKVRGLVPADLAQRYGLYPLEESSGTLIVAVSDPVPSEVIADLEFSLGLPIEQRATTRVRVQQAIARDYGVAIDHRDERVLARLEGRPDPYPTQPPSTGVDSRFGEPAAEPAESAAELAEPIAEPEQDTSSGYTEMAAIVGPKPVASQPHSAAEAAQRISSPPRSLPNIDLLAMARAERQARRQRRRLGPYTLAMAESDLIEAKTRDEVVTALFDFAAQYFDYSALFAVQSDLLEGRDAHGSGAPRAKVRAVGVPLDLPSTLATVLARDAFKLVRFSSTGIDGTLIQDLERSPGRTVLLLPIRVRGRAVLMLYGDHGDQDVTLEAVGDLISFAPLVAGALERLIRRKKDNARGDLPNFTGFQPPRPRRADLPSREERASALASVLERSPHRGESVRPGPEPRNTSNPPFARPVISVGPGRPTPAPGALRVALSDPPESQPRLPTFSIKPLPPISRTPIPSSLAPGAPPQERREPNPPLGAAAEPTEFERSETPLALLTPDGALVPAQPADTGSADGPHLTVEPLSEPLDDLNEDEIAPFAAPLSRSLSYSARPLPMPGSTAELRLPTVIVDLAHDTEDLVARAVHGEDEAAARLVKIGAAAVPALVGAFPGPITSELRKSAGEGPPRASDCGPILKILARIGPKAAGVLSVRSNDHDPVIRGWATRLLGELPCIDAARAVARRFVDEDAEVRRGALAAGRQLQSHNVAGNVLASTLAEMLLDSGRNDRMQHMIIEAIADLREARAIPALATLLAAGSQEVQRSAHWALVVLARTDHGDDAAAWDEWWRVNGSRHRIEWLIDALMHDQQEIRRAAGDELKSLTKEYFGYYDDLPSREREKAQARYREWWESKGKARFV